MERVYSKANSSSLSAINVQYRLLLWTQAIIEQKHNFFLVNVHK